MPEVRVTITVGDVAHLATPLHTTPDSRLRIPAARIAQQAGLPVNELPGRRFTVECLTQEDADGFILLDDPRL